MVTSQPRRVASRAYEAIMSSASTSSSSMHGSEKARVASRISGNWGTRSSGGGGRLAL